FVQVFYPVRRKTPTFRVWRMSTSITDILPKAPEDSLCTISLTGSQHKPQGMVSVTLSVAPPEKPCGLIATDLARI
ncbi:hypothetical protein ACQ1OY_003385, partial [Escherichia coli]